MHLQLNADIPKLWGIALIIIIIIHLYFTCHKVRRCINMSLGLLVWVVAPGYELELLRK